MVLRLGAARRCRFDRRHAPRTRPGDQLDRHRRRLRPGPLGRGGRAVSERICRRRTGPMCSPSAASSGT